MKKTFYKVIFDKDHWWIEEGEQLKMDILDLINDNEGRIRIQAVQMTQEKFDALPEYSG